MYQKAGFSCWKLVFSHGFPYTQLYMGTSKINFHSQLEEHFLLDMSLKFIKLYSANCIEFCTEIRGPPHSYFPVLIYVWLLLYMYGYNSCMILIESLFNMCGGSEDIWSSSSILVHSLLRVIESYFISSKGVSSKKFFLQWIRYCKIILRNSCNKKITSKMFIKTGS